ncbi:SGNH/GDSL hydrolase family protein [Falsirhodobacter halotolerans]|uniref:SGNH/GDSL hydrolase family protein n=1 Tax=Falsirhodobacter halotolerans TaxID=1146892 RepID=UPI001FD00729|nr:SGNH/GDSL hydrolase family protein [Falsirhodobacter halotolerans]MCJ8139244.1 SGNH/GDSL hydrolase family protein [Falsirhodobacter halotolerans]
MRMILILALCGLTACGAASRNASGDILVMGDSVLAWNNGAVGKTIGADLDRPVITRARAGARMMPGAAAALVGLSIPNQLPDGRWNWIVMNGGANDLVGTCGCGPCEAEIDALMSPDATAGAIPDLIARARRTGASVMWMGYYQAPQSASFAGCSAALGKLETRIATYARAHDGVYFVDSEAVMPPSDPGLLGPDRTHPSARGSAILGTFLARALAR